MVEESLSVGNSLVLLLSLNDFLNDLLGGYAYLSAPVRAELVQSGVNILVQYDDTDISTG